MGVVVWARYPCKFLMSEKKTVLYRGTSLIRNSGRLEPYSRNMPRALWQSQGGGQLLMSEVAL